MSLKRFTSRRAPRLRIHMLAVLAAVASMVATSSLTGLVGAPAGATTLGAYKATLSPSSVVGGSTTGFTLTITNEEPTSGDVLNDVTVSVPSGFQAIAVSSSFWSAQQSGNTIELSNNPGLLPGASATATIAATAPFTQGTYTWATTAKGFIGGALGSPADFTDSAYGGDPTVTVTPAPATQLVFTTQPTATQVNKAISPAVTVAAEDAAGNVDPNYPGAVSLAVAFNPNTGDATTPSGSTLPVSATPVAGVATFSGAAIAQKGYGYTLGASSGSLTPATSTQFDVTDAVKVCQPNTSCSATAGNSNDTQLQIDLGSGKSLDVLTVTVGAGATSPPCSTTYLGQPARYDNSDSTRTVTGTLRVAIPMGVSHAVNHYGLCYAASSYFTGSTQDLKTGLYYGYLPACGATPVVPCLSSFVELDNQPVSNVTNDDDYFVAVFLGLSGDPLPSIGPISVGA